jgi:hypothetical protein
VFAEPFVILTISAASIRFVRIDCVKSGAEATLRVRTPKRASTTNVKVSFHMIDVAQVHDCFQTLAITTPLVASVQAAKLKITLLNAVVLQTSWEILWWLALKWRPNVTVLANATRSDFARNPVTPLKIVLAVRPALRANAETNAPRSNLARVAKSAPEAPASQDAARTTTVLRRKFAETRNVKTCAKIRTIAAKTRFVKRQIAERSVCVLTATREIRKSSANRTNADLTRIAKLINVAVLMGLAGILVSRIKLAGLTLSAE